MKSGYEITRYRPSMKSDVSELAKQLWSGEPARNVAHLEWKYERNPYLSEPFIHVALFEGRVVAMRSMFGMLLECGVPARSYPVLYADDMMVAPEHRGRGLVAPILQAAARDAERLGYSHLFNLSASSVTRIASLAAGWKTAGAAGLCDWRPANTPRARGIRGALRKNPAFRWLAKRISYRPWATKDLGAGDVLARLRPGAPASSEPIVVEQTPRPDEMASLVARLGHDGRIRHVRDEAYLSWRYGNPLHDYLFLNWRESALEGYLILRKRAATPLPARTGFQLVDWEASTPAIRAALLRRALALCAPAKVNAWTATLPPETVRLLQDTGFSPDDYSKGVAGYDDWVLVRPVADKPSAADWTLGGLPLLDLASWDLRMIYSMHG